mmetsp:Transcript_2737/g.5907  ORF Transcript_2737/g.5907 Transcript_2737/m.5907 type:complete len:81 (-) Transcript_2737:60-302(-)
MESTLFLEKLPRVWMLLGRWRLLDREVVGPRQKWRLQVQVHSEVDMQHREAENEEHNPDPNNDNICSKRCCGGTIYQKTH